MAEPDYEKWEKEIMSDLMSIEEMSERLFHKWTADYRDCGKEKIEKAFERLKDEIFEIVRGFNRKYGTKMESWQDCPNGGLIEVER